MLIATLLGGAARYAAVAIAGRRSSAALNAGRRQRTGHAGVLSAEPLESRTMLSATPLYWDPTGAATAAGGTGTWDTTTAEWRSGGPNGPLVAWANAGDVNGPYQAVFSAAGGTVTLGVAVTAASVMFSANYTLTGSNAITLSDGTGEVDATANDAIAAPIAGTDGLTVNGGGTLILSGSNTYSGVTTINAGAVDVTGNEIGATGGWAIGQTNATAAGVYFETGSTIAVGAGNSLQVGGDASSSGSATESLIVAGTVSNAGSLLVGRAGYLEMDSGHWSQGGSLSVVAQGTFGSNIKIGLDSSLTYSGTTPIILNPSSAGAPASFILGAGSLSTSAGFQQTVGGAGYGLATLSLIVLPSVTLTANIPSLFSGGIVLSIACDTGSVVNFNTGGFTTSIPASITDSEGLTVTGGGTLILCDADSYTGPTTVTGGATVQLDNVAGVQDSVLTLNGGSVAFSAPGTSTYLLGGLAGFSNLNMGGNSLDIGAVNATTAYSGVLSGSGSLELTGTGSLSLTGPDIYTGQTIVDSGTLGLFGNQAATSSGLTIGSTASLAATLNIGEPLSIAAGQQVRIGSNSTTTSTPAATLNVVAGNVTSAAALVVGSNGKLSVKGGQWTQSGALTLGAGTGGAAASVTVSNSGVFSPPSGTPSPATDVDIVPAGTSVTSTGSATFSGNTWSLSGAGAGLGSTLTGPRKGMVADAVNFLSQPSAGNTAATTQVVSQAASVTNAEAGLMFRDGTTPVSNFVALYQTPGAGVCMTYRNGSGNSVVQLGSGIAGYSGSVWLRLSRSGNTFTGYVSQNGTSWVQAGQVTFAMATTVSTGLIVSGASTSVGSATFSGTTIVRAAYAAPASLTTTAVSPTEIDLVWADVAGEAGFIVQRSPDGTTGWTTIGTTAAGVAHYNDMGLTGGTTYYYRVEATDEGEGTSWSPTASGTTLPTPATNVPTVRLSGASTVSPNSVYTLGFALFGTSGASVVGWSIAWGDGTTSTPPAGASSATHTYAADGQYRVQVTATTATGSYTSAAFGLDASFGQGGIATDARLTAADAMALQPDGHVIVLDAESGVLESFNADGSVNTAFGSDGVVTLGLTTVARTLAIDPLGNIDVAGVTNGQVVIDRYTAVGLPDPLFGTNGQVVPFANTPSEPFAGGRPCSSTTATAKSCSRSPMLARSRSSA